MSYRRGISYRNKAIDNHLNVGVVEHEQARELIAEYLRGDSRSGGYYPGRDGMPGYETTFVMSLDRRGCFLLELVVGHRRVHRVTYLCSQKRFVVLATALEEEGVFARLAPIRGGNS